MSDEDRRLHQRKEHSRSRRSFFEDPTHFQSSDEIYQSGHQAPLPSKKKPKKKITPILHDVYIPHLISVENLSRLLNIRLGSSSPIYWAGPYAIYGIGTLQRHMQTAGMEAESSYDYSEFRTGFWSPTHYP